MGLTTQQSNHNVSRGHIPKLAFKNGKAYCKICGDGLE